MGYGGSLMTDIVRFRRLPVGVEVTRVGVEETRSGLGPEPALDLAASRNFQAGIFGLAVAPAAGAGAAP